MAVCRARHNGYTAVNTFPAHVYIISLLEEQAQDEGPKQGQVVCHLTPLQSTVGILLIKLFLIIYSSQRDGFPGRRAGK